MAGNDWASFDLEPISGMVQAAVLSGLSIRDAGLGAGSTSGSFCDPASAFRFGQSS
jgi:hypothetical protein